MRVIVSKVLPQAPSPGEVGRRIVRHGLADVLEWLGEAVGPRPEDELHAVAGFDPAAGGAHLLMVSQQMYDQMAALPRGKTVSWDIPGLFGGPS